MADLPGMPSTIRCVTCGFENTTTSLYCQDCGVRLVAPPSAIADETAEAPGASVPQAKTKPRILSEKRENHALKFTIVTLRTLLLAAIIALIAVILLPPANLPPAASPLSAEVIENVRMALQRSAQTGKPFVAPWDGQGLNAYLAGIVTPTSTSKAALVSARLAPASDGFTFFTQYKIKALSLYFSASYRIVQRASGVGLELTGGSMGRLSAPAASCAGIELANEEVVKTLLPELQILRAAKTVRITPEKVFINFR